MGSWEVETITIYIIIYSTNRCWHKCMLISQINHILYLHLYLYLYIFYQTYRLTVWGFPQVMGVSSIEVLKYSNQQHYNLPTGVITYYSNTSAFSKIMQHHGLWHSVIADCALEWTFAAATTNFRSFSVLKSIHIWS